MFVNNASAVGRERGTYNRLCFTMKLNFENDDLQPKMQTNTSSPNISCAISFHVLRNPIRCTTLTYNNHFSSKSDRETEDGPD